MSSASKTRRVSLFAPGLFRLVLACLVFAQHSTRLVLGSMAVLLFFTLSGFWIKRMWVEKYSECNRPTRTFYISRLWRLLPAFWIANAAAICIAAAKGSSHSVFKTVPFNWHALQLAFANIVLLGYASLPHGERLLDTAWSLDVEVQFYLIFPLLFWLWPRVRDAILLIVGGMGFLLMVLNGEPLHRNVLYYLAFFAVGVLAEERKWLPSRRLAILGVIIAAAFAIIFLASPQTRGLLIAPAHSTGNAHMWTYTANCILGCLLLPFTLRTTAVHSGSVDKMLGDMSYLIYLFHMPAVALVLYGERYSHLGMGGRLVYLAAVWLGTLAISLLFWRFIHRPLDRRRRRFVQQQFGKRVSTHPVEYTAALSGVGGV
jgi:peptidoglycan/LPS O-acetylase OafA/YrhL